MKTSLFAKKNTPDPELERLRQELLDAQNELQQAYHHLDLVVEPELVESCVYKISAIQARCNFLIRTIKDRHRAAAAEWKEDAAWT